MINKCEVIVELIKNNHEEYLSPTQPGQQISVDQLLSPTPTFISQIKDILTKNRYRNATVFVDQYSRFTYTYLNNKSTSDETIEGNYHFRAFVNSTVSRWSHIMSKMEYS